MHRVIVRRFFFMIFSIVGATLIVFALSRMAGDPRLLFLGTGYTSPEQWEAWGREMGLDKPLIVQYFVWLSRAVRGDLGQALVSGYPVSDMIRQAIPATLQLGAAAWGFVMLTGIPLGVLSAVKRGTIWDLAGRTFALFGQALPPFWLGIMLVLLFSVELDLLPTGQRGGPKHYILPAITLGWLASAGMTRLIRSAMLDVLDSEYIKLARAKGVSGSKVIWKHALRNALITPLTFAALLMVSFLTGTVVTETVFAWPGLGRLTVTAINNNDFTLMTATVLMFTVMYVGIVFLVDVAYAFIDPRIRYA
jgi:peptide/nickel transport system permease protein